MVDRAYGTCRDSRGGVGHETYIEGTRFTRATDVHSKTIFIRGRYYVKYLQ